VLIAAAFLVVAVVLGVLVITRTSPSVPDLPAAWTSSTQPCGTSSPTRPPPAPRRSPNRPDLGRCTQRGQLRRRLLLAAVQPPRPRRVVAVVPPLAGHGEATSRLTAVWHAWEALRALGGTARRLVPGVPGPPPTPPLGADGPSATAQAATTPLTRCRSPSSHPRTARCGTPRATARDTPKTCRQPTSVRLRSVSLCSCGPG